MDELDQVRAERIAELEKRRPRGGVSAATAALCIAATLVLFKMEWGDVAYYLSPPEPITLGAEGDYHLERLRSNRYVQVHGTPTLRGAYGVEHGTTFVVLGLKSTPLLVRRPALPTEQWAEAGGGRAASAPPQPDQRPFAVRGRLLAAEDGSRFRDAFEKASGFRELEPDHGRYWIILESQRPREDAGALAIAGLLAAFGLLNVFLLARSLKLRISEP
jgi:hypothetical protein